MIGVLESLLPDMTTYERWRVILGFVQVIATLGVPFVVIALDRFLKNRKRRKKSTKN